MTEMDGSHLSFVKDDLEPAIPASDIIKLCWKLGACSKIYYFNHL